MNVVEENVEVGIGVFDQAYPTLKDNQCIGNDIGIYVDAAANPILENNDCRENPSGDLNYGR